MKQALMKTALIVAGASMVISCSSTNSQSENTTIGAVSGAVIGGVAASAIGAGTGQVVAIGVGAIAGALIGGYVGHSMDHSDNMQTTYTLNHTPKNKTHHWVNKSTGAKYSMTPTTGRVAVNGQANCRNYNMTATMNGKQQTIHGTACRQADGSWKSVN